MKSKFILVTVLVLLLATCKKDKKESCSDGKQNQGETGVDCGGPCNLCPEQLARQAVIDDYNNNYLTTSVASSGWNGDVTNCNAGTIPQSTLDMIIKRINYFRRLVGLNDNTTLDASQFAKYQETALMMKINGLNHFPPTSWTCWTQIGSDGAATSNLYVGTHSTSAITGFIQDPGAGNTAVGHRRWILHSAKTQFSCGSTNSSMALGVMQVAGGNTKIPEYIAYPPSGYIPSPLVFARWSFGVPGASFAAANVTMTGPGGVSVPLTVVSKTANGYGDNTIVWEPTGIVTSGASDVTYTVNITDVSGLPTIMNYTYTVTIVKP